MKALSKPAKSVAVKQMSPSAKAAVTRRSKPLTLADKLSHLTYLDACKLLGPTAKELLRRGTNGWELRVAEDVKIMRDCFELRFPSYRATDPPVTVGIRLSDSAVNELQCVCTQCRGVCGHLAAALSLILEEKVTLGLAEPPPERVPVESLNEAELVARAVRDRQERSRTEKMNVRSEDSSTPWSDYEVTNRLSGRSYRVALRGLSPGQSFCNCPDFRTNTLGTCKHVMHVVEKLKRRFTAKELKRPFKQRSLQLHLRYDGEVTLRLLAPEVLDDAVQRIVAPLLGKLIADLPDLLRRVGRLQKLGHDVEIFPDAEEFIQQRLHQLRLQERTADIRRDPANHLLRTTLLKTPLLPYQLDGVAFAASAGRAVLADDMGLGKTIQGVGVAEFLAREAGIKRVLVVCPTSLKSQWRAEIHRFCDRNVQIVAGPAAERSAHYRSDCFFTICNYEQVLRDLSHIERAQWDLIILDEGQRIKNWEAKTSRTIKSLRSRYALVLSGTPLENRLDELYSVVEFIDGWRLGPGFRFFNKHRMVDDKGKVLGYKNLADLRETLKPVLLRRTRDSVKLDLPPRTMEIVRVTPTLEQLEIHDGQMRVVASIVRKPFISEMDLLRLQKALLMCRMAADSTYLVDKQAPGHSTKLAELDDLLGRLLDEEDRKIVLFSEWTTMLDLIEPLLNKRGAKFARLDGSVPQQKRAELVQRFQTEPDCKLFLTTNAGSTGLNLQAANTVINVDLPWNPAVLEQRIARAHRMGQTQAVQVYVLVTEQTLEENLLATLAAKKDLALAALDVESDVDEVEVGSGLQQLKGRLEVLLGARPDAPVDSSAKPVADAAHNVEPFASGEREPNQHRERVAAAGGELLGAAFKFLGELVSQSMPAAQPSEATVSKVRRGLAACVEPGSDGQPRLVVKLPSTEALNGLAETLARLLVAEEPANVV